MNRNLRMPAEWEPQSAVWFAWPANTTWWPGNYDKVTNRFGAMIAKISNHTPVKLICCKKAQEDAQKKIFQSCPLLANIEFVDYETDDVWCRDFGPIFVQSENKTIEVTDWEFNAWGAKFPNWDKDNGFPERAARLLDLNIHSTAIILEGGAIDVNGKGTLLTTEDVLLNPNRNEGMTKEEYEALFKEFLGIDKTIWLNKGLHNDDTDGHIDNLARFINEDTIAIASEANPHSPNFEPLRENLEILRKSGFKIVEVPLPDPVMHEGEMLPASYMNFLITNDLLLVPVYNKPEKDKLALEIFKEHFPNHQIEGFDCNDFLLEGGAIHCLSQQQPAPLN